MILEQFKLDGKVAIVTGARTGLGKSMAIALAEAGADIIGVGRNEMPETEKAIRDLGRRFLSVQADLSSIEPLKRIMEEAIREFGKVDILLNNAGIVRRQTPLEFSEDTWDIVMDTNLKSVFFLSQAFARNNIAQGRGGKIINVGSVLSFRGAPRGIAYGASKHGIEGISKTMAISLAEYGINCNAIAPGYMKTDQTAALRTNREIEAESLARIPIGRWGQPEDLQGAVVFLASDASNYMTGATICVDGGWLAK